MNNNCKTIAAIDLGSNSFHMIVAIKDGGSFQVVDRIKESVRLASGINSHNQLSDEVSELALDCLSRFNQRLKDVSPSCVRVVGTSTMRKIDDNNLFFNKAIDALGHDIEIITGTEEARLVYLGVSQDIENNDVNRLVVDIGGGSTELILGRNAILGMGDSLSMGCVSVTNTFFSNGEINQKKVDKAMLHCSLKLRPMKKWYANSNWELAIGSSGTARALLAIHELMEWSDGFITEEGLDKLLSYLISCHHIDNIKLKALSESRRLVIVGGAIIMKSVFSALKIEKMQVSAFSLREGLLKELLGSDLQKDIKSQTIESLMTNYKVDKVYANMVLETANKMFSQVKAPWSLSSLDKQLLEWSVSTSEIGLSLNHRGFHKHSAYILNNIDLPGFSRQLTRQLSVIVENQRKKINKKSLDVVSAFKKMNCIYLIVLLRLSLLLHRGRMLNSNLDFQIAVKSNVIKLSFSKDWYKTHPLNVAELYKEKKLLKVLDIKLKIKTFN